MSRQALAKHRQASSPARPKTVKNPHSSVQQRRPIHTTNLSRNHQHKVQSSQHNSFSTTHMDHMNVVQNENTTSSNSKKNTQSKKPPKAKSRHALRTAILALPVTATATIAAKTSMYLTSLADGLAHDPSITSSVAMASGAVAALLVYSAVDSSRKLLDMANRPSEACISDIVRQVLSSPFISEAVGSNVKVGRLLNIAHKPHNTQLSAKQSRQYIDWLRCDPYRYTSPIPSTPLPSYLVNIFASLPVFQTAAWNLRLKAKCEEDMIAHPEDYLHPKELKIMKMNGFKKPTKTDSEQQNEENSTDNETLHLTNDNNNSIQQNNNTDDEPLPPPPSSSSSSSIFGSRPQRLQIALHIRGDKDEGMLLCEVEQAHKGREWLQGGDFTVPVLNFQSLVDGAQTISDEATESPTLLGRHHAETIIEGSAPFTPMLDPSAIEWTIAEDMYRPHLREYLDIEKRKRENGIYH